MNPCTYQIQRYSYTPSKKVVTLEERRERFRNRLKKVIDEIDPNCVMYPTWLRKEFWTYWTALDNDFGRKMKFEKEKSWNTKLRLATWKRNASKDPRWKTEAVYKPPKKSNNEYGKIDYEKHKERQGENQISTIMRAGERLKKNWKR